MCLLLGGVLQILKCLLMDVCKNQYTFYAIVHKVAYNVTWCLWNIFILSIGFLGHVQSAESHQTSSFQVSTGWRKRKRNRRWSRSTRRPWGKDTSVYVLWCSHLGRDLENLFCIRTSVDRLLFVHIFAFPYKSMGMQNLLEADQEVVNCRSCHWILNGLSVPDWCCSHKPLLCQWITYSCAWEYVWAEYKYISAMHAPYFLLKNAEITKKKTCPCQKSSNPKSCSELTTHVNFDMPMLRGKKESFDLFLFDPRR